MIVRLGNLSGIQGRAACFSFGLPYAMSMMREASPSAAAARSSAVQLGLAVVIPAYNEEEGIVAAIDEVEGVMRSSGWAHEIIVVDDGSTDRTRERAESRGVQVIRFDANQGYGAALKAGFAASRFEWVAIIDADGTYPSAEIPRMLERLPHNDMVVGARIGRNVHQSLARRPAKWLLRKFAGALAGREIPDLNSGLRIIRKSRVQQFAHILPQGFSFTTTITLALHSGGYPVAYVPIDYHKRVGQSKIRPFHAVTFAFLILRTMMLFRPLRVLGPPAAF